MFADLHLHTNFSDGTYTPEELAQRGHEEGLHVMALTDHDTIDGCERMGKACEKHGIRFIPACEITAEVDGCEIHMLGYQLNTKHARFLKELSHFQAIRQNRVKEIVHRLNKLGIPLSEQRVLQIANCDAPGRPHIGRALVEDGHCKSLDEAFKKYLKANKPAWVPRIKIAAEDAIALIHEAGGVAVMAHPGLNRIDQVIPQLVEAGMDGIECFHSRHSTPIAEHYLEIADRYKLVATGGSDCHGMNKGKPLIGSVKLPLLHVEQLLERVVKRRSEQG